MTTSIPKHYTQNLRERLGEGVCRNPCCCSHISATESLVIDLKSHFKKFPFCKVMFLEHIRHGKQVVRSVADFRRKPHKSVAKTMPDPSSISGKEFEGKRDALEAAEDETVEEEGVSAVNLVVVYHVEKVRDIPIVAGDERDVSDVNQGAVDRGNTVRDIGLFEVDNQSVLTITQAGIDQVAQVKDTPIVEVDENSISVINHMAVDQVVEVRDIGVYEDEVEVEKEGVEGVEVVQGKLVHGEGAAGEEVVEIAEGKLETSDKTTDAITDHGEEVVELEGKEAVVEGVIVAEGDALVLREQGNKGGNLENIKQAVKARSACEVLACKSSGDGAASCVDPPKKAARRLRKSQHIQRRDYVLRDRRGASKIPRAPLSSRHKLLEGRKTNKVAEVPKDPNAKDLPAILDPGGELGSSDTGSLRSRLPTRLDETTKDASKCATPLTSAAEPKLVAGTTEELQDEADEKAVDDFYAEFESKLLALIATGQAALQNKPTAAEVDEAMVGRGEGYMMAEE